MTFIFKTSVKTNRQVLTLKSHIDKMLPKGKRENGISTLKLMQGLRAIK